MPESAENPGSGHERRDVDVGRLLLFAAGLCAMILFSLVSMKLLFGYYSASLITGPLPSPLALAPQIPPQPRLQITGQADLERERQASEQLLNSYGWVDRQMGVVHIPIDLAMDLITERGLPTREQGGAKR